MAPAYRVEPFGRGRPAPAHDLAALHRALFAASPPALLGPQFLERFYYLLLPGAALIYGAVAYVDNVAAGFIVATDDGDGFMGAAIRRWWWRLPWVVGLAVMSDPRRIGAIWEALQIMRSRTASNTGGSVAELLTFGVLERYRSFKFIRQSELHIAADLFAHAMADLRARDVKVVRAIVDADNTPAKLFYKGRGWTLVDTAVPGWRVPSVEFQWHSTAAC